MQAYTKFVHGKTRPGGRDQRAGDPLRHQCAHWCQLPQRGSQDYEKEITKT